MLNQISRKREAARHVKMINYKITVLNKNHSDWHLAKSVKYEAELTFNSAGVFARFQDLEGYAVLEGVCFPSKRLFETTHHYRMLCERALNDLKRQMGA